MAKKEDIITVCDRYSKNPFVKEFFTKGKKYLSQDEFLEIIEYEHGMHLAYCIEKEFRILELNTSIEKYKEEHSKSLSLMIEIEHQKLQLEEYNKKLAEADRAKTLFLANMSHEIRTPMNGILGMTSLLMETEMSSDQEDFVQTIKYSADALLTIINDILDLSKIDAGKFEIEEIDFNLWMVIDSTIELLAPKIHDKGIEFISQIYDNIPPFVKGDPGRLRQILLNFVGNSLKFTEEGEISVVVTLESEDETSVIVKFTIKDTGIGIPDDRKDRIFKMFSQVDPSTTRKYGGTGLGLAISKELAGLMGGSVGFESKFGGGSVFWFTISLKKQRTPKEKEFKILNGIEGRKILAVDDNRTQLKVLTSYLKTWGCRYKSVLSSSEALNELRLAHEEKDPYEMVLSDHLMPEMDGEDLCREIKKDPQLKNTLIIMLSSSGIGDDAATMKKVGYSFYLTKPVNRTVLLNCMKIIFAKRFKKEDILFNSKSIPSFSTLDEGKKIIRILLVDDNPVNQKLVSLLLKKAGYLVETVSNGKEALQMLEKDFFNLVLMDIQMPVMDGLEATRVIRDPDSSILDHKVPVIGLTAKAMKGDKEICLKAGMDGYLTKPIDIEKLFSLIKTLLI